MTSSRRALHGIAPSLVAIALTVLAGCGERTPEAPAIALKPDDPATVALGRKVYDAECASCHGARLEGQPNWQQRDAQGRLPAPPHDASGHTWHHTDELLFRITKHGVAKAANLKDYDSAMPAYEGRLSDEEIVAVLSWIKSQWPAEIRRRHDELNRHARQR